MSTGSIIRCDFQHDLTVNYAMQQNHVPVVKQLAITNIGNEGYENLTINITTEPEFALPWQTTISSLAIGETVALNVVDLQLSHSFLFSLTERLTGSIRLEINNNGSSIYSATHEIDVLAYDEWNGIRSIPEIIAAFILPNHPEISRILQKSSEFLLLTTGTAAIDGYQRKDLQHILHILNAIYSTLKSLDITYCVPPASFEEHGQKVRMPDTINDYRLGTCLDLTLLYAACVEAAGLYPLIIFTEGHAFLGVWLVQESFAETIQDDITLLTKRIAPGMQEICLIETTALTAGNNTTFNEAVALAEMHLANPQDFHFFVDIHRARSGRIHPLPYRISGKPTQYETIETTNITTINPEQPLISDTNDSDSFTSIQGSEDYNERTRLGLWERRLLDLSLRNTLINFRVTGANIPILTADLYELENALADGKDFQILPRPTDWEETPRDSKIYRKRTNSDPEIALLLDEFLQHRLRADLPEKDLSNRLTQLYRNSRISMEENGANTLYLALGMLVWYETDVSQQPRYAPVLMVPMEIVRKSVQTGYLIRQSEDEPQLNITLVEMLRHDFGIEISGLVPLPTDEHGVNVKKIMSTIRREIMHKNRWDIVENAHLGLFSFSKFVMWYDIKARTDELKRNKVVASLIAGSIQWDTSQNQVDYDELDNKYSPKDILCPISVDSSQLAAICASNVDKSFVLHGPPGTGKSQTITNMIANAMAQGKSVLFVAEKMAALSVVQRRLSQIHLAPFCLELHSNKSKKKDVLEQLRIALEIGNTWNPPDWNQEAERLTTVRNELNQYVQALHSERKSGHSIYQGLSRYLTVRNAPNVVEFSKEQIQDLTSERLQVWNDLARKLQAAGEGCGHPYNHPWSMSQRSEYNPQLGTQILQILSKMRDYICQWQASLSPVSALFQVDGRTDTYAELYALNQLAHRFLSIPAIPGKVIQDKNWDSIQKAINDWITHGRLRDQLRSEVYRRYTEKVLDLDLSALQDNVRNANKQWFLPKLYQRFMVIRTLRTALKHGCNISSDDLEAELALLNKLKKEEIQLSNASDKARDVLGDLWQNGNADWGSVESASKWISDIRKYANIFAGSNIATIGKLRSLWSDLTIEYRDQFESDSPIKSQLQSFVYIGDLVENQWNTLKDLMQMDQSPLDEYLNNQDWFKSFLLHISIWENNVDKLRDWCVWVRQQNEANQNGLTPLVNAYRTNNIPHSEVIPAYTRGLYKAWLEEEISNDPSLSTFSRSLFEDKIKQFRELDDHFAQLTCQEIFARLASRIPRSQSDPSQNSEVGILGRELGKQRNLLALRTLFQKIPNVLTRLKPCLLMSPMSVAQYLEPSHPPFDLVIFDEASQVPTCDAVGAIARGKEVIIVGDPKQLPPTNFFTSINADENEDNIDIQDLDSILDDCLAIRMPEERLLWHYRSRHESLITFSNHMYYDNKLLTFPSPDDLTPMVRFIPIDGIYDRGKSKQNKAEAQAVVAEIVNRLSDLDLCKQSIGVVTFSQVQQQLIEDLLDEQQRLHPELERFFSNDMIEPVFVKNLENVQGDERDVILFSIGYGPDAQGRVSMNFGPLNKDGGWRRLNVAVSRAREEMLVFSTLRAKHLDISRTSAKGVAHLKAFLEYAERGKDTLYMQSVRAPGSEYDSVFEEQVRESLRNRGHIVHTQVGCSGYRIDLAVVDNENKGRYLLGIECDGLTYHRAKTARDRDKLRESVLNQLGWRIHRVWSTDWWENPTKEIERLETVIADARKNPFVKQSTPSQKPAPLPAVTVDMTHIDSMLMAPAEDNVEEVYKICELTLPGQNTYDFYSWDATSVISDQISQIVNTEGPISHSLLCRRIIQVWGMTKVGSRIDSRIRQICAVLRFKTTQLGSNQYYWPLSTDPKEYSRYRIPDPTNIFRREAEDIVPEEIANAAYQVLRNQISLPEPDLLRESGRMFGYQRVGPAVEQHFKAAVNLLLDKNIAARNTDGRIVLTK